MATYIRFVLRRPKTVLFVIAVITVILAIGITKIKFDNSIEVMMPEGDSEYIYYQKIQDIYGNTGNYIILDLFSDGNLWTAENFREMDKLISDIEEYKTFNKELEDSRLAGFRKLLLKENIQYTDFLDTFEKDESFKRLLERKISKVLGKVDNLTRKDLTAVEKELLITYSTKHGEKVAKIISPLTMQDISGENDSLVTFDIIEKDSSGNRVLPSTEKDFQWLKNILLKTPSFEKQLFSKNQNGEITDFAVLVTLDTGGAHDNIADEIWELAVSQSKMNVIIQGMPIVNKELNDSMYKDMKTFMMPIFLVMIFVFFLNFKSVRGVVLPQIILMISTTWLIGLMGHLGFKFTVMSAGLPVFIMAVGSSYSIHILNQYYIDFSTITERGKREGLRLSMSHISITILLAGLTTFIGFLTLSTNQVTGIKEWAIFSALGVLICVLLTVSIIPSAFLLLPHKMPRIMVRKDNTVRKSPVDRLLPIMIKISTTYHKPFLVAVVLILSVSVLGIFKMNVETDILSYFEKGAYIRKSMRIIGDKFGGASGIDILIDSGKTDGIIDPQLLKRIETFREFLEKDPELEKNIGGTSAFSDFIKKMNMAMNEDDISQYKIPDSREEILDYLELFSSDDDNSDGRPDVFESFVDPEFRTAHLFARICSKDGTMMGTRLMDEMIKKIQNHLKKAFPEYETHITGGPSIFIQLSKYIVSGQVKTLLFCLVVVCIIMILLFKNILAGIIALIPMSVAVIINFGIMGWFKINLDMSTALIAAVTIGIGVDDTIHFLNSYRFFRNQGYTVDETIDKTLKSSGKAIIYTSMALIFGFSVLMLSSFVPLLYFGFLLAISMIATTIGALIVLPAAIKATNFSMEGSISDSFVWKYLYIGRIFGLREGE